MSYSLSPVFLVSAQWRLRRRVSEGMQRSLCLSLWKWIKIPSPFFLPASIAASSSHCSATEGSPLSSERLVTFCIPVHKVTWSPQFSETKNLLWFCVLSSLFSSVEWKQHYPLTFSIGRKWRTQMMDFPHLTQLLAHDCCWKNTC